MDEAHHYSDEELEELDELLTRGKPDRKNVGGELKRARQVIGALNLHRDELQNYGPLMEALAMYNDYMARTGYSDDPPSD